MRSNFKYVAVFILSFLSLIFLLQILFMKNLYDTANIQLERSIIECLEIADLHELQHRVDSLDHIPDSLKEGGYIEISNSLDLNPSNEIVYKNKKKIVLKGDTLHSAEQIRKTSLDVLNRMNFIVKEALHEAIDSIARPNLTFFYHALDSCLQERKIHSKLYRVEHIHLATDSIIGQVILSDNSGRADIYDWVFDQTVPRGYRIYIEPLMKSVLHTMIGSLTFTLILILFLSFSFWYLIRTIFQLKTLEEMKEDFTNNMTHELKTPIAVAYSATDALVNFGQGENKEKRERYLYICKEQLEKLSGLVEQILSMSMERRTKLTLKREEIQVREMLETLSETHRIKAKKEVVIQIHMDPENLTIVADKTHFNHVMSNLIDNAIKYSTDSVSIHIQVRKENGSSIFTVRDNGIGIPPDKQKYLFDKFYRVPQGNRQNAKGYGIGLYYVKTIVEKHGGTIHVESITGRGTVFTINLP